MKKKKRIRKKRSVKGRQKKGVLSGTRRRRTKKGPPRKVADREKENILKTVCFETGVISKKISRLIKRRKGK